MRVRNLLAVLAVLVAAPPLLAHEHVASVVNDGVEVYYRRYPTAHFAGEYASVWPRPLIAPWRYAPDPYSRPPVCLPSYYRPIFPWPAPPVEMLPVAAMLARLKQLDYSAFGRPRWPAPTTASMP